MSTNDEVIKAVAVYLDTELHTKKPRSKIHANNKSEAAHKYWKHTFSDPDKVAELAKAIANRKPVGVSTVLHTIASDSVVSATAKEVKYKEPSVAEGMAIIQEYAIPVRF